MKYSLKHGMHRDNLKDGFWLGFTLGIVILVTLYGYKAIEYVSTHNILRGQF